MQGDCYVAVTGVPEAQADHAMRMARFAFNCLDKVNEITRELEVHLGPDSKWRQKMRWDEVEAPIV